MEQNFQATTLFVFHISTLVVAFVLMLLTPTKCCRLKHRSIVKEEELLAMDPIDLAEMKQIFQRTLDSRDQSLELPTDHADHNGNIRILNVKQHASTGPCTLNLKSSTAQAKG